jgi:hypothetical protein
VKSTIRTFDHFPILTAEIEQRTRVALAAAAEVGMEVANEKAVTANGRRISSFRIVPVHESVEGYASGIRANNPLYRIFNKGSLGKHRGKLKRSGKDSWDVNRRGSVYTAHRGDVADKGISARDITNPARAAGRKALIDGILGRR